MAIGFVRPHVADMVLRVFDRSVHPELIEALCECGLSFGNFRVTLRISSFGHVIEVRGHGSTITEVATSRVAPLPAGGRMVDRRLIGYRTHTVTAGTILYQCSYQLDTVTPDVFLQQHRELEADARKATLTATLPGSTDSSPLCLSLLKADLIPNGIVIHSTHTFPDFGAVLRIQSLFECDRR